MEPARVFPYTIDAVRNIALVKLSGTVRGSDVAGTMEALYGDPCWTVGLESIWDGTKITTLLFEVGDMPGFIALAERYAAVIGSGRVVLVVTRPIDEMMARIYAGMSRALNRRIRICKSLSEAIETLGRPRRPDLHDGTAGDDEGAGLRDRALDR